MVEPGGVLGAIVARKKIDVAARLGGTDISDLRGRGAPTTRSLAAALAKPGARFVMEVKRGSPSGGTIRAGLDPAALARGWKGTADAMSVLTDAPYFGGSFEDLAAVRAGFDGPVLAKDFIVDPRQVAEARLHGADAVLVMLSVLDDNEAAAVMAEARALGMDVLVEAHDEAEVARAVALGAPIVGINNRDLKTLTVDLAVTERLAAMVPKDRLVVAESGIENRADVERLAPHADAFLVGSSLMRAEDPVRAARALAFGRVKVCGLTRAEDAASAGGAAYGGIIMVPGSPRCVGLDAGREIADAVRDAGMTPVVVTRDSSVEQVAEAAETLGARAVQLHGSEDGAYVAALRRRIAPGTEIWAAAAVGDGPVPERAGADRILFDTKAGGRSGGTGKAFDWERVAARPELPAAILAGGLSPDNAREAARVGAYAIDVNSGVESAPGRKDGAKLAALFEALRVPARGDTECA